LCSKLPTCLTWTPVLKVMHPALRKSWALQALSLAHLLAISQASNTNHSPLSLQNTPCPKKREKNPSKLSKKLSKIQRVPKLLKHKHCTCTYPTAADHRSQQSSKRTLHMEYSENIWVTKQLSRMCQLGEDVKADLAVHHECRIQQPAHFA
jgi:hypothetical protein